MSGSSRRSWHTVWLFCRDCLTRKPAVPAVIGEPSCVPTHTRAAWSFASGGLRPEAHRCGPSGTLAGASPPPARIANFPGQPVPAEEPHPRDFGLKPHLADTFKLSTDPLFVDKVVDVVGLYHHPPDKAMVLCVWTKRARSRRWTAPSRCCR
jgi:hypothetical protein